MWPASQLVGHRFSQLIAHVNPLPSALARVNARHYASNHTPRLPPSRAVRRRACFGETNYIDSLCMSPVLCDTCKQVPPSPSDYSILDRGLNPPLPTSTLSSLHEVHTPSAGLDIVTKKNPPTLSADIDFSDKAFAPPSP